MADEPFYAPNHKLPSPRLHQRGEPLWTLRANGVAWEAELRDHAEWGVEAQILRYGELVIVGRFDARALAMQWTELERDGLVTESA